jgi:hypothetical protein
MRTECVRGLTHKLYASHRHRSSWMVAAETRHLDLILRATIGLIRQVLYLGIHIIVCDKNRLPLL